MITCPAGLVVTCCNTMAFRLGLIPNVDEWDGFSLGSPVSAHIKTTKYLALCQAE